MLEILKKYLVLKWWIPTILFGISIIILLTETIFPDENSRFYTMIFFAVFLLVSIIWQFFRGKIIIGLFQLSVLAAPFLFLGLLVFMFAGVMDTPDGEVAVDRIELLIKKKTDLVIPRDFVVLENLIEHTEGALDSDYSIKLKIEYQEIDQKKVCRSNLEKHATQIR